ncbi:MAG: hypothetical protein ACK2UL_01075 [Anaerolineae bacterium]|jgi:hypothetical protein
MALLYALILSFCGWQLLAVTVKSSLAHDQSALPNRARNWARFSTLWRAILTGLGIAVAALLASSWRRSGASLGAVLGAPLLVGGLFVVVALAARDSARTDGDHPGLIALNEFMSAIEEFVVWIIIWW